MALRNKVQSGMSQNEVRKLLGKPDRILPLPDHRSVACYYSWKKDPRFVEHPPGYSGPTAVQIFSIRFDSEGMVEDRLVSEGAVIGNSKIRGVDGLGAIVPVLDANQIRIGKISIAELFFRFGSSTPKVISNPGEQSFRWLFIDIDPVGRISQRELVVTVDTAGLVAAVQIDEEQTVPGRMFTFETSNDAKSAEFLRQISARSFIFF